MTAQGLTYLLTSWWVAVLPAAAVFVLAFTANFAGGLATLMEVVAILRVRAFARIPRACLFYLLAPLTPAVAVWLTTGTLLPMDFFSTSGFACSR